MRNTLIILVLMLCAGAVIAGFRPFRQQDKPASPTKQPLAPKDKEKTPPKDPAQTAEQPTQKTPEQPAQTPTPQPIDDVGVPYDDVTTVCTGAQYQTWPQREVDGKTCRVSPPLEYRPGCEVNHHRVTVTFTGSGTVELSVAHYSKNDLQEALTNRALHSRFVQMQSDAQRLVSSRYRGERFVWLILNTSADVTISKIQHTCWRGTGTLFQRIFGGCITA